MNPSTRRRLNPWFKSWTPIRRPNSQPAHSRRELLVKRSRFTQNRGDEAPLGETTQYIRDAYGSPTTIIDPMGAATRYVYDADHNLVSVTDRDNHTTTTVYDFDNLPIQEVQANGTMLSTAFNGSGLVISQTDGNGHATTYTYDSLDRPLKMTDPLGYVTTLAYDSASRVYQSIDPQITTTFTYDAAGELTDISYSDGTPTATFLYDSLGRRTGMTDGTGTTTFVWDSLNRLTSTTDGAGNHVSYSYDLAGRMLTLGYASGGTVSRRYDNDGRLASITDFAGAPIRFSYDADSRMIQRSYPNGTTTAYGYDPDGRLSDLDDPLFSAFYTRDPLGLITHAIQNDANNYTYTALNQLAGDSSEGYNYDAAPNLTKLGPESLNYNAAGEINSATPRGAFTYDMRGDRTEGSFSQPSAIFKYDGARRLTAFGANATYTYTGDSLRATKTVSSKTQTFVWDRAHELPTILEDGVNRYIYGPGGMPLEQVSSAGTRLFFHQDQLGSTRALSASGSGVAPYTFDSYGNPQFSLASTQTPLLYAGQYTDSESGLVYMRSRYYDPGTGQFITRDPLNSQTRQPYLYAGGDPVNLTDPTGLQEDDDGGVTEVPIGGLTFVSLPSGLPVIPVTVPVVSGIPIGAPGAGAPGPMFPGGAPNPILFPAGGPSIPIINITVPVISTKVLCTAVLPDPGPSTDSTGGDGTETPGSGPSASALPDIGSLLASGGYTPYTPPPPPAPPPPGTQLPPMSSAPPFVSPTGNFITDYWYFFFFGGAPPGY